MYVCHFIPPWILDVVINLIYLFNLVNIFEMRARAPTYLLAHSSPRAGAQKTLQTFINST